MTVQEKHWSSRVEYFETDFLKNMIPKINEFCKGRFVVGIQYFQDLKDNSWHGIVSYKVKEE